jgi:hypothetical protein
LRKASRFTRSGTARRCSRPPRSRTTSWRTTGATSLRARRSRSAPPSTRSTTRLLELSSRGRPPGRRARGRPTLRRLHTHRRRFPPHALRDGRNPAGRLERPPRPSLTRSGLQLHPAPDAPAELPRPAAPPPRLPSSLNCSSPTPAALLGHSTTSWAEGSLPASVVGTLPSGSTVAARARVSPHLLSSFATNAMPLQDKCEGQTLVLDDRRSEPKARCRRRFRPIG